MLIDRLFKIAAQVACIKTDRREFHLGCAGIRSDGVMVIAANGPVIIPAESTRSSFPKAHAEIRCSNKLDKNSVVFVSRVRRDTGMFGLARPCPDCMRVLISKNVKTIYYTISQNQYGIIQVKNKQIASETIKNSKIQDKPFEIKGTRKK